MISLGLATWIVRAAGLYLLLGALVAIPFAWRWSGRLDPVAAHGTSGFRLLLIPGAILLWPLLLSRVLRSRP
jgi:hypothetical protein